MKIVFVIPTLRQGGMERVVSELANYFDNKDYKITIIFLVKNKIFYELNENVKTISPSFEHSRTFLSKLMYKIRLLIYIRKKVKSIKPTCVISLPQKYNNLTILALLKSKVPVYVSDRNNPLTNIGFANEFLRKKLYPYADGIIAQTEFAKKTLLAKGIKNNNIKVIPNPVKNFVENTNPKTEEKIVLNVGRLSTEKNQKHLIDIFNEINNPKWKLIIVGSGNLFKELQDYVKHLGLEKSIKLVGAAKNVEKWLAVADIFAFTSLTEGFPNALIEAMAYPLPCISYDCKSGPSDIIKNNTNGFLIPMNEKELYKKKLKLMMESQSIREDFKKEAFKVRSEYSLEKIGDEFLNFCFDKNK